MSKKHENIYMNYIIARCNPMLFFSPSPSLHECVLFELIIKVSFCGHGIISTICLSASSRQHAKKWLLLVDTSYFTYDNLPWAADKHCVFSKWLQITKEMPQSSVAWTFIQIASHFMSQESILIKNQKILDFTFAYQTDKWSLMICWLHLTDYTFSKTFPIGSMHVLACFLFHVQLWPASVNNVWCQEHQESKQWFNQGLRIWTWSRTCPYQYPATTIVLIKQLNICICNHCCCNFVCIWNKTNHWYYLRR